MISIIIPVYNMEKLLPRCMNTLIEQAVDHEIILVDDGSTDKSPVMCDDYMRRYPTFIKVIHKKNGGLSSARNAGMDSAKGRYVIFPDPDDWVDPDYISKLDRLQNAYQADLLCVGYYIDTDEKSIPVNLGEKTSCVDRVTAQRALLRPPCMGGFAWNKLYHLDLIREHQLRFLDDVGIAEDLDFTFRYLMHCETVCFAPDMRVYHYYQREGAATHSKFSMKKMETLHTYEKIMESSKDEKIIQAAKEEICNTAINFVWQCQNSSFRNKDVLNKLQETIRIYLKDYLKSAQYEKQRKLQAVMACYIPNAYALVKKCIAKDGE